MTKSTKTRNAAASKPRKQREPEASPPPDFFQPVKFDGQLKTSAEQLIEESKILDDWDSGKASPNQTLDILSQRLRRPSSDTYYKKLALAYAFWIRLSINFRYQAWILDFRRKRSKERRIDARSTPLHFVVEAFIEYGSGDAASYTKYRQAYNRDVRAILWLHRENVRPSDVELYLQEHPEGCDKWARKFSSQVSMERKKHRTPTDGRGITSSSSKNYDAQIMLTYNPQRTKGMAVLEELIEGWIDLLREKENIHVNLRVTPAHSKAAI